jgi:TetR/AcrR family transcriptional regulator, repressor for uid operon
MRKVDPTKHEKKRREILMAAGRCFERNGFQGATTADICAEAKISPGHLYHYFAKKEAIVAAMAEARLAMAAERFEEMTDFSDPITTLINGLVWAIDGDAHAPQALFLEMFAEAGRNPAIAQAIEDHSRPLRGLLSASLKAGQQQGQVDPGLDPDIAAAILMSLVDGAKIMTIRHSKVDAEKRAGMLKLLAARFLTPPDGEHERLRNRAGLAPRDQ